MVRALKIENFKSIKNQRVDLTNLNILIGQNGAGKSNFISLFKFFERLARDQSEFYFKFGGGINNFLYNGYSESDYLKIHIEFDPGYSQPEQFSFKINSNGQDYFFSEVFCGFWDEENNELVKFNLTDVYKEIDAKANIESKVPSNFFEHFNAFKDLRVYHFEDTSDNAILKTSQEINDVYFFKNEAENLAPFLLYLQKTDVYTYKKIVDTIWLIYPKFNDFELKEDPYSKDKIFLRWTEKGTENIFNIKQMSDGTLRFICLATLLLQPANSNKIPNTIILDEPELGLHPSAIHILAELIKTASLDRQIIIATQSVNLINYFKPEDLLITERDKEGATIFKRKTSEELADWLEDYSLGEIWETNLIGGRP